MQRFKIAEECKRVCDTEHAIPLEWHQAGEAKLTKVIKNKTFRLQCPLHGSVPQLGKTTKVKKFEKHEPEYAQAPI